MNEYYEGFRRSPFHTPVLHLTEVIPHNQSNPWVCITFVMVEMASELKDRSPQTGFMIHRKDCAH